MRLLYAIDKAGADPVEYVKGMLAAGRRSPASAIASTRPRTPAPPTCAA
jgi:hypothetical protein